jgi:two-component sensor histidine kinase
MRLRLPREPFPASTFGRLADIVVNEVRQVTSEANQRSGVGGEWILAWSIRTYLVSLALACAMPVAILAGFFAFHLVSNTAQRQEADAEARLYLLRDGVELRIEMVIQVLEALASSPDLRDSNLGSFRDHASATAKSMGVLVIVLSDRDGHQVVNTRVPLETVAPPRADVDTRERVFATGLPQISDLHHAKIDGRPVITVEVPVRIDGENRYALAMGLEPSYLTDLLNEYVPAGEFASIVDRKGILIARHSPTDTLELIGQPATPDAQPKFGEHALNWMKTTTRSGTPIILTVLRSERTGWSFRMALPQEAVQRPINRSIQFLLTLVIFALLVSFVLASIVAGRFFHALQSLQKNVTQLGRIEKVHPQRGGVAEINVMEEVLYGVMRTQEILRNEIDHRAKNTLATVQSIARLTLSSATTVKEYAKSFEQRLIALSTSYDLLTENNWVGADLRTMLERTLSPFSTKGRISIEGPAMTLDPRIALSLAAAIQELSTNAAKYGALSVEYGRLEVFWSCQDNACLSFNWIELDGPPVEKPRRRGFGTILMQDILAAETGWKIAIDYALTGLRCTLLIDL